MNGDLFVNLEYGNKVLHTTKANYSFQNLHTVLRSAIKSVFHLLQKDGVVLNLGMGGGSAVVILREELDFNGKIVSVEHDPVIVEIAIIDFDINRFANHEIIIDDAAHFVDTSNKEMFSLIICDLFKDKHVPTKFQTITFFESILTLINKGGHLIFNFIYSENQPPFFEKILSERTNDFSHFILNPVKDNHVLVLTKK